MFLPLQDWQGKNSYICGDQDALLRSESFFRCTVMGSCHLAGARNAKRLQPSQLRAVLSRQFHIIRTRPPVNKFIRKIFGVLIRTFMDS